MVQNLCNFLESFISKPNSVPVNEKKEVWIRYLNAFFGFSFIWAFGAHYKIGAVRFLDNMLRDFFGMCHIPLADTVFEYWLEEKTHKFIHYKETIKAFEFPDTPTPFF